jgi:hypothetical protein
MVRLHHPKPPKIEGFSQLGWYHILGFVPDNWEFTHYGIDEGEGRLDFCNREWHQARFSWKKGKEYRKPDLDRTLAEFHKRYLLENHKEEVATFSGMSTRQIGSFLFAYDKPERPCQAACYIEESKTVMFWTFPSFSEELLRNTFTPILESCLPNDAESRVWSAFGMSFVLGKDFDLEDASILPADASLMFEHSNRQQMTLHRWGLPSELLRGQDLKIFYYRILGGLKNKVMTMEDSIYKGMPSVEVTLTRAGTHAMDKLYGGEWSGSGRIWHNVEEQRLYAYEQAGPKKVPPLKEAEIFS